MNIWLDKMSPSMLFRDKSEDCGDCGDCGIMGTQFLDANFSRASDDTQLAHMGTLQLATPLHTQACSNNRWLVCNPTGTGRLLVLDAPAFALLKSFRSPMTLQELFQKYPEYTPSALEQAVTLFYKVGLLQDPGQPRTIHMAEQNSTLVAWMHVTNACNLRCHYCYISKTSESMNDDTARRSIDAIFRSALKRGFKHVRLKYAGGEASLNLSRVLAIHDYAGELAQQHALAFSAFIISNGVALPQRTIDQFKARGIGVTISLDGIEHYHDSQRPFVNGQGSFKYVDRTIERLLASDMRPHINVTVSQRSLTGLPELMRYILERDLSFTLSYYRENDCSDHLHDLQYTDAQMVGAMRSAFAVIEHALPRRRLLDSLIDKADMKMPHRHTCGVGQNYLVIDQHGGIARCHAAIEQTITSINADDPLSVIQHDQTGVQGLPVEEKEGCRSCDWRYWCGGGCPLLTHRITGRYDVKSPNCTIYKALFPDALRLEGLRLLKYESPVSLQ